ncbi:MAG: EamA/RhaT family transporter [Rhodospirillaceae bacterium TMED63]|nr:EamA family transporter [Rhodospirillaceae bacterium]RPF95836.1 MAG: EamA/RhaT family transporter [Rhodospirillaceae bacterium TMED63]
MAGNRRHGRRHDRRGVGVAQPMTGANSLLLKAAPFLFILTWASGFPITRFGLEFTEPFTLLWIRSAIVVVIVSIYAAIVRAPWPDKKEIAHIAVVGVTLQCLYLGAMFSALGEGVSQGVAALVAGMQPLLTAAVVGITLGERVSRIQWAGFVLGFAGLFIVLSERLGIGTATTAGFIFSGLTPIFITAASLYQKKYCANSDLRIVMIVQQTAAGFCNLCIAMAIESSDIAWGAEVIFVWAWLVVILTIGATNLLYLMLRHGETSRVSSLFYLTPPTAVFLGWVSYDETMGIAAMSGFLVSVAGVFLVTRTPRDGT